MRTLLTIHFYTTGEQQSLSFVRPRSRPRPTDLGAARMVARELNERLPEYEPTLAKDISIQRIEEMHYA